MMHHYKAYGLTVASEIELPELVVDSAAGAEIRDQPVDLTVTLATISRTKPQDAFGTDETWATRHEVVLNFEQAGRFLIRRGREIVIDRAAGVEDIAVRLYLLGPAIGTLLHQRQFLVLHASAVAIDGAAVAFLAEKGTGKSTLAAAFHARGHMLVADDIVPVDVETNDAPLAYPGFPQLKLFPEAAAQLGDGSEELPRLLPNFDKRARRLTAPFPDAPLPLRGLYVLTDGESERIESLPAQQAFISLVRHTFVIALLRATSTDASHFHQAIQLARILPVRSLQRRRSLSVLPEVVRMVEAELARH